MSDRNETMLVGTIYGEPKCGKTKTGDAMALFSVSVKRPEPSQASDLINVTAWDDIAREISVAYHDGSKIAIKGRLQRTSYVAKDGTRRSVLKVYACEIGNPDEKNHYLPVDHHDTGRAEAELS